MKPFEQLIVKCAAVIGENTSRTMLKAVVPGCNEEKFKSAIFRLMHTRVFVCAAASLEAEKVKSENIQSVSVYIYCFLMFFIHLVTLLFKIDNKKFFSSN